MDDEFKNQDRSKDEEVYDDDVPKTGEQVMEDMRGSFGLTREDLQKALARFEKLNDVLKDMKVFNDKTSNMFKKVKHGVEEALDLSTEGLSALKSGIYGLEWLDSDMDQIDGVLERTRTEGSPLRDTSHSSTQTEEAVEAPAPHHGKREREFSLSPAEAGCSKPQNKRLRILDALAVASSTPKMPDIEAEVASSTKRKKHKKVQMRARPEAVLIKPADGLSYAEVLKDLKQKIKPDSLGVKIRGVRETKNGEVLIEVGHSADGRTKLSSAIKEVVSTGSTVRELVPRMEVEISDLDTTSDEAEVTEAVLHHFGDVDVGYVRVHLTKRAFRGSLKAYVELREELAERLARTGHLKVGWMSCRVRKKTVIMRCFRCHGFGHVAAKCEGPDRTKMCWTCGLEGHKSAECVSTPQCFLCAAHTAKPRTDHRPGTMRCTSFREATQTRKPPDVPH